jgi:hypothetical protein
MSRDWQLRIEDILAAVERATRFVGQMDLAAFKADERTAAAVLHQIFLIGEAAARLREPGLGGSNAIFAAVRCQANASMSSTCAAHPINRGASILYSCRTSLLRGCAGSGAMISRYWCPPNESNVANGTLQIFR